MSIKSEIEEYQNLIMDLTRLIKGNKYKDEIRSTKKGKEIPEKTLCTRYVCNNGQMTNLTKLTHGSLFSGIGGFDLASEWAGFENVFQVEIDEFCQQVLKKNFPNTQKFKDIKEFNGTQYRGAIDILTGGFPCQPFSHAGKRKGSEDERAIFPEMLRVIREIQPRWVVAENVSGILSIHNGDYFEEICTSLENENYEVQPVIIPASSVNAPHKRDRVWIVAKNTGYIRHKRSRKEKADVWGQWDTIAGNGKRIHILQSLRIGQEGITSNTTTTRLQGKINKEYTSTECSWDKNWVEVATELCGVDDGLSVELDGFKLTKSRHRIERLKSLGNAIVPQVAYQIFKAIRETN